MSIGEHRVGTTGEWTIALPDGFELIDNGDSWQAYQEDRVIYVSSMLVRNAEGSKTDPESLCAAAVRTFDPAAERHSHTADNARGEAEVRPENDHWQLKGVMCVAGVLATCVIDYWNEDDKRWAIATWRSLKHP